MKHARKDYNRRIQDADQKIPINEPVFLIRGQDLVGAEVVRFWAQRTKEKGGDSRLIRKVLRHAKKMEDWPRKKVADCPVGQ